MFEVQRVLRSEPGQPESRSRGEQVVPWAGMWTGDGGSSCKINTNNRSFSCGTRSNTDNYMPKLPMKELDQCKCGHFLQYGRCRKKGSHEKKFFDSICSKTEQASEIKSISKYVLISVLECLQRRKVK
jgi:hypothetical protein